MAACSKSPGDAYLIGVGELSTCSGCGAHPVLACPDFASTSQFSALPAAEAEFDRRNAAMLGREDSP
jgi:hypothetical protein